LAGVGILEGNQVDCMKDVLIFNEMLVQDEIYFGSQLA
jgi:hypothetical protein